MSESACLHCAILDTIKADAIEQRDGEPLIDGGHALYHLGRVAAQIIASVDGGPQQAALFVALQRALIAGLNDHGVEAVGSVEPASPSHGVRH